MAATVKYKGRHCYFDTRDIDFDNPGVIDACLLRGVFYEQRFPSPTYEFLVPPGLPERLAGWLHRPKIRTRVTRAILDRRATTRGKRR